ncbi:MAG TPA: hypothetical protein VIL82_00465 [Solirubrobacteraceae bacterium]
MRVVILIVALVFIGLLGALTVRDIVRHGVTPVSVLAVLVLTLFCTGIVGALRHPPPND